MISYPNAKINLGLNVISKRPDGYHNILSVFYPIPCSDILECIIQPNAPEGSLELSFSGLKIPGSSEENLLHKAHRQIAQYYPLPALKVHLHKNIPMGAGLGGGSSDAAFFIQSINSICELQLAWGEMHQFARGVGSDCPFFLVNKPSVATGTGTELKPVPLSLEGIHLVLLFPGIHISTPEAYQNIHPRQPEMSPVDITKLPVNEWRNHLKNDFETYAFSKHPELQKLKDELYRAGAMYASMSGSGSTIFGLFAQNPGTISVFPNIKSLTLPL